MSGDILYQIEKVDIWLWENERSYSRDDTAKNFLKANDKPRRVSDTTLRYYRYVMLVVIGMSDWYYYYIQEDWWHPWYIYLTGWAWYVVFGYSVVAVAAHVKYDELGYSYENSNHSFFQLWKVFIIMHELAFVNSWVVGAGFWIFIYPTYPWGMYYLDYLRHGGTFLLMLID